MAPKCFLLKMNISHSSYHLLWFPVLFGSNVFLQSNSTFLVVPFTFHGSQCCLAPKSSLLNLLNCWIWTVTSCLDNIGLGTGIWIIWETKVLTFRTFIQVRFWDIIMQILDGFFRVKPENIGFATCMKNIGLRFASSDIFHTCSSSSIFRYHPQAIHYCMYQTWSQWPVPWPLLRHRQWWGQRSWWGHWGQKGHFHQKGIKSYRILSIDAWLMHMH